MAVAVWRSVVSGPTSETYLLKLSQSAAWCRCSLAIRLDQQVLSTAGGGTIFRTAGDQHMWCMCDPRRGAYTEAFNPSMALRAMVHQHMVLTLA